MGCCTALSKSYLNLLNGLTLLCSLVIFIYSTYSVVQVSGLSELVSTGAITSPLVFSALLFFISLLGLIAVNKNSKVIILVYFVSTFLATIAVLVSGIVLIVTSGVFKELESETVNVAAGSAQAELIDLQLAVYQRCCAEQFGLTPVPVCGGNVVDGCFSTEPTSVLNRISDKMCESLADFEVDGEVIVGNVTTGGCAGGDPSAFVALISAHVSDNIFPLGVTSLIVSIVLFLDLIASCVVLFSSKKKEDKAKEEEIAEAEEVVIEQKVGPELAA